MLLLLKFNFIQSSLADARVIMRAALTNTSSTIASTRAKHHRRPSRARRASSSSSTASSSADANPVLICPGLGNQSSDYDELVEILRARGHAVVVANVARIDWARNAAGVVKPSYWQGTLEPRPTVDWYLERCKSAVRELRETYGAQGKVSMLAHSAGGWLARVYIDTYDEEGDIGRLVSLGSPMKPVPRDVPGVIDQTRGILTYVDEKLRTVKELAPISVTCVAGTYLRGRGTFGGVSSAQAFIVGQGYKQVCGDADADGDGITPVETALMDDAEHIILEGIYHTPLGAGEDRPWYGSPGVVERWANAL